MAKGWPSGVSRTDFLTWKKKQINDGITENLSVQDYKTQKAGGVWIAPIKEVTIKKSTKAVNSAEELQEEEEKESPVIVADTEGYYGISFDKRNVTVWKRSKYENDDVIVQSVNGEEVVKTVSAGDWKDWQHERGSSRGPFYSGIESAKKYIEEAMVKEAVRSSKSVSVYREAVERSKRRVDEAFGNV